MSYNSDMSCEQSPVRLTQANKNIDSNERRSIEAIWAANCIYLSGGAHVSSTSQFTNHIRMRTRGQSLMEFALVLLLLLLLIFGIVDFSRLFFAQMSLQNAVRQAGRFAVTGNHLPDPTRPGVDLSRVDSIKQILKNNAVGLNITAVQITSKSGGSGSAGGPGDTVTVSITTDLKLLTPIIGQIFAPNGIFRFTVAVSFRNEPFPPGNTL